MKKMTFLALLLSTGLLNAATCNNGDGYTSSVVLASDSTVTGKLFCFPEASAVFESVGNNSRRARCTVTKTGFQQYRLQRTIVGSLNTNDMAIAVPSRNLNNQPFVPCAFQCVDAI